MIDSDHARILSTCNLSPFTACDAPDDDDFASDTAVFNAEQVLNQSTDASGACEAEEEAEAEEGDRHHKERAHVGPPLAPLLARGVLVDDSIGNQRVASLHAECVPNSLRALTAQERCCTHSGSSLACNMYMSMYSCMLLCMCVHATRHNAHAHAVVQHAHVPSLTRRARRSRDTTATYSHRATVLCSVRQD